MAGFEHDPGAEHWLVHLELAHACIQSVADRLGVRLLHIKGLASGHVLGGQPGGGDVDVLVDPDQWRALCRVLDSADFCTLADDGQRSTTGHSRTYTVTSLGIALDVHREFPGFAASPWMVFDLLWDQGQQTSFGQIPVRVPSKPAAALMELLHAARAPRPGWKFTSIMHRWDSLESEVQKEALELARTTRATRAVAVATAPVRRPRTPGEAVWWAHQAGKSPAVLWMVSAVGLPGPRRKFGVVARCLRLRRRESERRERAGGERHPAEPTPARTARETGTGRLTRCEVAWVDDGARATLMRLPATTPVIVEGAGRVLWDKAENPSERGELVHETLTSLHGAPDDASEILEDFIDRLVAAGCLCPASSP